MSQTVSDNTTVALPEALRAELVRLVDGNRLELPLLPEVASQVISLSFDEECDLRKLTEIINRDQAMTGHVLRLANSALYAPPTPIVSLQQALNRLGLKKIREIALLISCESRVFKVDGFDLRIRAEFKHSIGCATFAQEIARLRRWNVEEAFLCGLLSDVGRPVVLQALVDLKKKMGLEAPREAMEATADEFHCVVGGQLVKSWELPARLSETIVYHHEPEAAPTAAQTAMMTRLAADLAHWLVGPRKFEEARLRAHPICVPLNIYPEEMEGILAKREEILAVVESIA